MSSNLNAVAAREAARPAPGGGPFDSEADVVVVGGGGGGLPTALFSRWLGDEVILLEKAPELGGTAKKAAFWYWVPNNEPMRAAGLTDERNDFLRYVARLSRPTRYDPDSPTLGLTGWEYAMASAIYESASPAAELLAERGALPYRHCPAVPDYWSRSCPRTGRRTGGCWCRWTRASRCPTAVRTRCARCPPRPSGTAWTYVPGTGSNG
jgi:3-oxosteroid 1-dehydrogenase